MSWQDGGMRPTAYRRNAHGLRDRQAFERIRLQAGELFAAGRSQAEVARDLGVAPAECQPLACLLARWRAGRIAQRRPNRACPRLSDLELAAIRQALRQGVRVNGFNSDHWTLARITTVIERVTGVAYHPGRVWKLLRRRLGWWLQRPARRAIERDEQAIARWVETDWPRIRETPADVGPCWCSGMSRGSRCCR
jgi:transposase